MGDFMIIEPKPILFFSRVTLPPTHLQHIQTHTTPQLLASSSFLSFLIIPASLVLAPSATAKLPALTPSAPLTPKYLIPKNTLTTMALRGMPKRFIMTERWDSGIILERSVPIRGK